MDHEDGSVGPWAAGIHHIGVETGDLAASTAWYHEFFGCRQSWSLSEFSATTRARLPGIQRLVEMTVGELRVHLFERCPSSVAVGSAAPVQHVCLSVPSADELAQLRERWLLLAQRHPLCPGAVATAIEVDADGVRSFYANDPDGTEYEFRYAGGSCP